MRIISLNTWGGRAMHPLMHFFTEHGPTTDIFCLQEMHNTTREYRERQHPDEWVRWDLWEQTQKMLPDHDGILAKWDDNPDRMSVALFIRNGISVAYVGDRIIHTPTELREHGSVIISPRKLQYVVIGSLWRPQLTVVHYHGLWNGDGKDDTPERIEQSRALRDFADPLLGMLVLCGDFNFHPGTESYRILREGFDGELVRDQKWATTRTPLYRHFGKPGSDPYADYLFVRGVPVKDFCVMKDLVSDHAPLRIDVDR